MKKIIPIFMLMLLSLLLLFIFFKQTFHIDKIEIVSQTLEDNELVRYPIISNLEVDKYIEDEIIKITNALKKNYPKGRISIDYTAAIHVQIINYKFTIIVYENDALIKNFIYTYNFSLVDYKKIIIDNDILANNYLQLLNEQLIPYQLCLNQNDLKYLKYLIFNDAIEFILPKELTKTSNINITLPSYGIKVVDIAANFKQEKKYIALTFDDGPSKYTKELVDLLKQYQVKATFFLVGERIQFYQEMVKYIFNNHHEIGNHSYNHVNFKNLSAKEIKEQIDKTQNAIYNVIHSFPRILRFPYGSYATELLDCIDYPIIMWDCDSKDWQNYTDQEIVQLLLPQIESGSVILFHDLNNIRKQTLTMLIEILQGMNYELVTISELFELANEENTVYGKIYY